MIKWLRRQESVNAYTAFLQWVMPDYEAVDLEEEENDDEEEEEEEFPGEESSEVVDLPQEEEEEEEEIDLEAHQISKGSTSWYGETTHTLAKCVPHPNTSVQTAVWCQRLYTSPEDFHQRESS